MNDKKRELLMTYIKNNVAPILIDFDFPVISNVINLTSECDITDLNGQYSGDVFEAPSWYKKILKNNPAILLIENIDKIKKEEQLKFIEILKYRKVSTFELPENTIIIVTAKKINKNTINEEIYSLVAHIKE